MCHVLSFVLRIILTFSSYSTLSKKTTARLVYYSGSEGEGPAFIMKVPKSGQTVYKNIVEHLKTMTKAVNNQSEDKEIEDEFIDDINKDPEFKEQPEGHPKSYDTLLFLLSELGQGTYCNDEFNFQFGGTITDNSKPYNKPPNTREYLKPVVVIKQVDSAYTEDTEVLKTLAGAVSITIPHGRETYKSLEADEPAPSLENDAEAAFLENLHGKAKASTDTDEMKE